METNAELSKRTAVKKDGKARKKLEKKFKTSPLSAIAQENLLENTKQDDLSDITQGKIIGRKICHIWSESNEQVVYNRKVEKTSWQIGYLCCGILGTDRNSSHPSK